MTTTHQPEKQFTIDRVTGLDVEDLFGQVEWYQARWLIHPNDDQPSARKYNAIKRQRILERNR
jgi:hypothetical protein